MSLTKKINRSDIFGAAVSGLCAVHCTVTPLLFAAKPLLDHSGSGHHPAGLWGALDYVFLLLSLLAVWYSARHTRHPSIKWVLWVAWVVFAAGLLLEQVEFPAAKVLLYAGSITLVVAHVQNYRYCRSCETDPYA